MLKQWFGIYRISFLQALEYTRYPVYDIMLIVKIWCYTETVIRIFKLYTVIRIRCYIGIIPCILTDSYWTNKRKYRLHEFMESLYNDIRESYSKNMREKYVLCSPVFCPNTGEYGAKNSVFMVLLCSRNKNKKRIWLVNQQQKLSLRPIIN